MFYKNRYNRKFEVADKVFENILSVPMCSAMSDAEVKYVVKTINKIIGKAWESSSMESSKKINTVIGFPFASALYSNQLKEIISLKKEVEYLEKPNAAIKELYTEKLESRAKQLAKIKTKLNKN